MKKTRFQAWTLAVAAGVAGMMMLSGCRSKSNNVPVHNGLLGSMNVIPPPYAKPLKNTDIQTRNNVNVADDSYPVANDNGDFVVPDYDNEPLEIAPANPDEVLTSDPNTEPIAVAPAPEIAPAQPAPQPAAPATPAVVASARTYTVEKGDTLGAIAKRYGVSWKDIAAVNPGVRPERLRIGQKLVLPEGSAANPAPRTGGQASSGSRSNGGKTATIPADGIYTVVAGDSLWTIAHRFKISSEDIRTWNNLTSDRLKVGQKLKLRGDATGSTDTKKIAVPERPAAATPNNVENTTAPAALPDVLLDGAKENQPAADPLAVEPAAADPLAVEPAAADPLAVPANDTPIVNTPVAPVAPEAFTWRLLDHSVSDNDTLESLSEMYSIPVDLILNDNPQIKNNDDLKRLNGTIIKIPYRD